MSLVTDNLAGEYVGKLAKLGTAPNSNADETNRATWTDSLGSNDITLTSFDWLSTDGWAGSGTSEDPYCLISDGGGSIGSIPNTTVVNPTSESSFSIECWYYRGTTAGGNPLSVMGNFDAVDSGWELMLSATNGYVQWFVGDGTDYHAVGTNNYVGYGAWKHVILTYNGTSFVPYIDGSQVDWSSTQDWSPADSTASVLDGNWDPLAGKIATMRFYSAALSSDDVAANYAAGVLAASTDSAGGWTGIRVTRHIGA